MTRSEIPLEVAIEAYLRLKSYERVAAELGTSRWAVREVLVKAGVASIGHQEGIGRWTRDQVDYLERTYGRIPTAEIAETLGVSVVKVRRKGRQLGLARGSAPRWTAVEVAYLSANYHQIPVEEIAARLCRSRGAVRRKAAQLGLQQQTSWTLREVEYLTRHYGTTPHDEIADHLQRSVETVRGKARRLGLQRQANRCWASMTPEDATRLFSDFKRSRVSVTNFCHRYGFSPGHFGRTMRIHFGEEYEEWVERLWPKNTWYVRGRAFELSVRKYLERNGYPHVVRSYRSRGIADLTAVGPGGTLLVQCKRGGYLRPAEHNELWELADRCGAAPILAGLPDGRNKRFWVLTEPHTRRGHRPIEEITFPWSPADRSRLLSAA